MATDREQRIKEDFRVFLYLLWKHLKLPEPTEAQYDIAQYLQDPSSVRKVLMAFRGVGKSWICSAYVLWRLYRNPDLNILVVSASKDRSDSFSRFTHSVIEEWDMLADLRPRQGHGFNSNNAFTVGNGTVSHSPSIKAAGLYGMLTGNRADLIISDDCEVPNNSDTIGQQEKLSERVKEFSAILKPDNGDGELRGIFYLGTPQTESTIYTKLQERGYSTQIWPARVPDKPSVYADKLGPLVQKQIEEGIKAGTPTDPRRFDDMELADREVEYGRSGFRLQYMLDPTLSDENRFPLKCSDFVVMDVDPEVAPEKVVWASNPENIVKDLPCLGLQGDRWYGRLSLPEERFLPYSGIVMAVDPSGRGADETGYAVVGMLHGQMFLMDAGGFKGGYEPKTLAKLANIAKRFKVNLIQCEPNYGGGMFNELFKPVLRDIYPVVVEDGKWNTAQKEGRIIDTLEPVLNGHKLVIDKSLIRRDATDTDDSDPHYSHRRLIHQLTRIHRARGALRHDDRLDPLSMAIAYWVDQVGVDVEAQIESNREDELEDMLNDFMESVGKGSTRTGKNWLDQSGLY